MTLTPEQRSELRRLAEHNYPRRKLSYEPSTAEVEAGRRALAAMVPLLDALEEAEGQLNAEVSLMAMLTGRDMVAEANERATAAEAECERLTAKVKARERESHRLTIAERDRVALDLAKAREDYDALVAMKEATYASYERDLEAAREEVERLMATMREVAMALGRIQRKAQAHGPVSILERQGIVAIAELGIAAIDAALATGEGKDSQTGEQGDKP